MLRVNINKGCSPCDMWMARIWPKWAVRVSSPTARGMMDAQLLLPHLQGLSAGLGDARLPLILRIKDFWDFMGSVVITWGQHCLEVDWT